MLLLVITRWLVAFNRIWPVRGLQRTAYGYFNCANTPPNVARILAWPGLPIYPGSRVADVDCTQRRLDRLRRLTEPPQVWPTLITSQRAARALPLGLTDPRLCSFSNGQVPISTNALFASAADILTTVAEPWIVGHATFENASPPSETRLIPELKDGDAESELWSPARSRAQAWFPHGESTAGSRFSTGSENSMKA